MLSSLNDSQRQAVEYIEGPSQIIAGAGSGKTRVLTHKIVYLLQKGYQPWQILSLTFTNKAANEMKERVASMVDSELAYQLPMGTFHSIFSRILRREALAIGYTPDFTIYDESDSRSLVKSIIKEISSKDEAKAKELKDYKPATVHNRISLAKNHLISAEKYSTDRAITAKLESEKLSLIAEIYTEYENRCKIANAMDFDDLLMKTYNLLKENEEIRKKYAKRFQFILVDEYQDTNTVQKDIIYLLAKEHQKVCVVGDDAQSIYAFRGANIDNILDFVDQYPETKLFKLEQNYRSTQNIVNAANSLILHNDRQIRKDVFSRNAEGDKINLCIAPDDKGESSFVASEIKKIKKQYGFAYSDFAILYRTNSLSRSFEETLRKSGMPCVVYGGPGFYQRKEIKDIVAYLRLLINHKDEEALRRIINYPARGIGETTIAKVFTTAIDSSVSAWDVICSPIAYSLKVNNGTLTKLSNFRILIESLTDKITTHNVAELTDLLIDESGIKQEIYNSTNIEDEARKDNIEEFRSAIRQFVDIKISEGNSDETGVADYLQEVALMTDADNEGDNTDKITLMTVHSAKGLEFPVVFVTGLEDGIFPSQQSFDSKRGIEEERRLLYVAITRAEKLCYLCLAGQRYMYGSITFNNPSRFIRNIDPDYIVQRRASLTTSSPIRTSAYNSFSKSRGKLFSSSDTTPRGYKEINNGHDYGRSFVKKETEKVSFSDRWQETADYSNWHSGYDENDCQGFSRGKEEKYHAASTHSSSSPRIPAGARRLTKAEITPSSFFNGSVSSGDNNYEINIGAKVEHQRFGKGTVLNLEGYGENAKAIIKFEQLGTKTLLLKFAKLKTIG